VTGPIRLPRQVLDAVVAHARFCHPYEACGLFAVDAEGAIRFVYACTNRVHSRTRYVIDPTEHFRAIQHAESLGWSIGGAFHSHPFGEAVPSTTDESGALDPTWFHVLVAGDEVRAWHIDGPSRELAVEIVA
jgi:proteasome lid subunit RPN8/RPN11